MRVCVKLRDASARARVSSTGRVSHVSHPAAHPEAGQDEQEAAGGSESDALGVA